MSSLDSLRNSRYPGFVTRFANWILGAVCATSSLSMIDTALTEFLCWTLAQMDFFDYQMVVVWLVNLRLVAYKARK